MRRTNEEKRICKERMKENEWKKNRGENERKIRNKVDEWKWKKKQVNKNKREMKQELQRGIKKIILLDFQNQTQIAFKLTN